MGPVHIGIVYTETVIASQSRPGPGIPDERDSGCISVILLPLVVLDNQSVEACRGVRPFIPLGRFCPRCNERWYPFPV